jgi:hypothetical protein
LAECHDNYPAVVYLSDKARVIECRDRIQWIVQRRRSVCPDSWRGISFCRTKEALLRCADCADLGALARLRALPEQYPEALIGDGRLDVEDNLIDVDVAQTRAAA